LFGIHTTYFSDCVCECIFELKVLLRKVYILETLGTTLASSMFKQSHCRSYILYGISSYVLKSTFALFTYTSFWSCGSTNNFNFPEETVNFKMTTFKSKCSVPFCVLTFLPLQFVQLSLLYFQRIMGTLTITSDLTTNNQNPFCSAFL